MSEHGISVQLELLLEVRRTLDRIETQINEACRLHDFHLREWDKKLTKLVELANPANQVQSKGQ